MRKLKLALVLSTLLFSGASFAQTAQPASNTQVYITNPNAPNIPGLLGQRHMQEQQPEIQQPSAPSAAPAIMPPALAQEAKTAAEQGFNSNDEEAQLRKEVGDFKEYSSARQRGVTVSAPGLAYPVAKQKENAEWLSNWEMVLSKVGVSQSRYKFEANRLSKEDFENWASRQYRVNLNEEDAGESYIQVKHRPNLNN